MFHFDEAAFIAIGAIAFQGIRQAKVSHCRDCCCYRISGLIGLVNCTIIKGKRMYVLLELI